MMAFFWGAVLLFVGLQLYVRLAPTRADDWVVKPLDKAPGDYPSVGGFMTLRPVAGDGRALISRFEAAMMDHPRTRKLVSGSGQDIYETRSAFWGFPDYTSVALVQGEGGGQTHAAVHGRLRFGKSDLGVNKRRLSQILTAVGD